MTFFIEVESDSVNEDEEFETSDELCSWLDDLLAEFKDTDQFDVIIINDLQTGDSG